MTKLRHADHMTSEYLYQATFKSKHFFIIYCQIWWKILAKLLHSVWFLSALSWYCRAIMNVWNVIYHFEDGWWPEYKYSSCCCCWCNRKIYYQPRPHFNGHWKMPASFNTNLRSATFLQKPKLCIVKASAALSWLSISWQLITSFYSMYFLMFAVSGDVPSVCCNSEPSHPRKHQHTNTKMYSYIKTFVHIWKNTPTILCLSWKLPFW